MKAIILAAGSGSRLAPIGLTTPKVLIPILNAPILHHHINAIQELVDELIVVVGPNNFGQQISDYIDSQTWPIPIRTALQQEPLGTAHAYQAAVGVIDGEHRLLCLNGDDLYSPQDLHFLVAHEFAVLGKSVSDPDKWGILNTDALGNLVRLVEKPSEYIGSLAYTGAAVLSTDMFNVYHHVKPSSRGEYEFTQTVTAFAQIHPVQVIEVNDYWIPIGYPWNILQAHQKLLASITHTNSPAVIMGDNVQISHNVELHGHVVIGDNVAIGDNSKIESSTILNNTTIGHNSNISHSVIGNHVTIGSHFTTLDTEPNQSVHSLIKDKLVDTGLHKFGTVIGDHVTIRDHVTTYPGTKIWSNCIIENEVEIKEDVVN